jgi:hypothetical protein
LRRRRGRGWLFLGGWRRGLRQAAVLLRRRGWYMAGTAHH